MNIKGRLAKVEQGVGMVAEAAAPCEACAPVWQARAHTGAKSSRLCGIRPKPAPRCAGI